MKEIINYFVQFYKWLDKLPCQIKTILIITLIGIIGMTLTNNNIKSFIEHRYEQEKILIDKQEDYLEKVAPQINELMDNIIIRDSCASNVILLNYHNTLMSSNGLAYKKLTGISEKFRGLDNNPCIEFWEELDYINFVDEIKKIDYNNFIVLFKDSDTKIRFPNIWYRLKKCEYNSAVLYSIKGINGTVGMLIVIYKNAIPNINLEYYHNNIYPDIHKLSLLLDYNNIKHNYED